MNTLFRFEKDLIGYTSRVKSFIEDFLLPPYNRKAIIGLNGNYGTGKSTFIELCSKEVEKTYHTDLQVMTVNVSESESEGSIVFSIINNLIKKIFQNDYYYNTEINQELINFCQIALEITVNLDKSNIIKEARESEEELLNIFTRDRKALKVKYKKYFEYIVGENKLVIFLDDLDRCSPDFAMKVLDDLRFYFKGIDNLIFVITYDKEQIESFIKSKFGKDIDHNGYLQKYFDIDYFLPSLNLDKTNFIEQTANKYIEYFNIYDKHLIAEINILIRLITKEKKLLKNIALRSIQQAIYRLIFGLKKFFYKNQIISRETKNTLILLLFLRLIDWELYTEFYKGYIDGLDVSYKIVMNKKFQTISENVYLFKYLLAYNESSKEKRKLKKFLNENIKKCKMYEKKLEKIENINYTNEDFPILLNDLLEEIKINNFKNPYIIVKICLAILEYDEIEELEYNWLGE